MKSPSRNTPKDAARTSATCAAQSSRSPTKVNLERLGRHFKLFTDKLEVKDRRETEIEELAELPLHELKAKIIEQSAKVDQLLANAG